MEGSDFTEKEVRNTAKYAMVLDYYYDGHYALQHVYNGQITKSAKEGVETYRRKGYNIRDPLHIDNLVNKFEVDVGAIVYDPDWEDDDREFYFLSKEDKEDLYNTDGIVCDLFQLGDIDEVVWKHAKEKLLDLNKQRDGSVPIQTIKEFLPWDSPRLTRHLLDYLDLDPEGSNYSDTIYRKAEELEVSDEARKDFLKKLSDSREKITRFYDDGGQVA